MKKKLLALAMALMVGVMSLAAVFPLIGFAAAPEIALWDETLINYEGAAGVTVTPSGQVEIPAPEKGMRTITGKRGDVGDFRAAFRLYLPAPDEAVARDQVLFGIVMRNQSADQGSFIGNTWPWYFDAYVLKFMPDGIQLMRGSNIIGLFGWTTLNLFDAKQHQIGLSCVNEGQNVRITLDADGANVVNFLDDGSVKKNVFQNPLKDHTGAEVADPVPLTGSGGFQLFVQNTSAVLAKGDVVLEETVPELTAVDITAGWDSSIADGTGMVMEENEMRLPNGKDQAGTYDTWNYALPTQKDLTNYRAEFKLTATPGDSADPIFRLVVKNAGKISDIVQMTWPLDSYTLEFHKGDFRLLRGANIMHYAGGATVFDGKEHDCTLTVYNNDKGGVTILFSYDGKELIRYTDLGGQTSDFFGSPISGGPLVPVTAAGSIQINTIDTALVIDSMTAEPAKPLKILFIGNSMTTHGPAPDIGWTGNWGMAASAEDKDYVHQLMKRVREQVPDADFRAVNVASFERDFANYNITQLAQYREYDADIIIMRACENVSPGAAEEYGFDSYILKLMDYLNPTDDAKFLFTTGFWRTPVVDQQIELAAASRDYPLVKLGHLGDDDSNKAYGLFEDQGVAEHPGDKGMLLMAEAIWASLSKILAGGDGHLKLTLTDNGVKVDAYHNDIPANTALKAETVRGELLDKANAALAPAQADKLYKISLTAGQTAVDPLDNVIVTLPVPNGAAPEALGVYAVEEDGLVKELAFDIVGNTVVFRTNQTGLFAVGVTPSGEDDGSEIYEDGLVEKSEIAKVLALSSGDKVVFRAAAYEGFTLDRAGFAALRYSGKDVEVRLKGGVMQISKEVFAAITAVYKDLDFRLVRLSDLSAVEDALKGVKGIRLYDRLGYEVSIRRVLAETEDEDGSTSKKTTALSLAYPITVTLPYGGKALPAKFKMLSIEEDGYLTLEQAALAEGAISFAAYELYLYAGVEAEAGLTEEDLNSSPDTGAEPLYPLLGIVACGLASALVLGYTCRKRRRTAC